MTPAKRTTIYCPASPELYQALDTLRRARQRETGKRVSLAEIVLGLVQTHPAVEPSLAQDTPLSS